MQEIIAIRRREDRRDRVVPMRPRVSRRHGQQMQIVVAENGDGRRAERFHFAQYRERIRAAVDEIADQPQAIGGLRKSDELEQVAELGVAALDVADRVEAHWCTVGAARRDRRPRRC